MDELSEIEQIVDTGTLTLGELLLAGFAVLVTASIARGVPRAVRSFLTERESVALHLPDVIGRVMGWCVMLGGIVLAPMIVGVQVGPVVLLPLIVVAVAEISGRQVLEDFAAGPSLRVTTPFVVGDRIETARVTGWVGAITGRAVVLTSRDRRTVHVSNSMVLDTVLYNHTDDQQRRSEVSYSVANGYDMAHVRQVMLDAVTTLELVHDDDNRIAARDAVAEAIMTSFNDARIDMSTPELSIGTIDQRPDHKPSKSA